jgi:hypothetical protein
MAERTSAPATRDPKRTPDFATSATGLTHPFLLDSPQFIWIFHPRRWQVIGGRLVPALSIQQMKAGVNGIAIRDGKVLFANVRAKLETQGRRVIPYEWAPDGESYMNVVETKPGGRDEIAEAWISVFETATVGSAKTETDQEAYAAWLDSLVSSGKLPPCPYDVAATLLTKAKKKLAIAQQILARSNGAGTHAFRVEAAEAEIAVLETYLRKARGEKVAPKRNAKRTLEEDPGEGEGEGETSAKEKKA